MNTIDLVKAVKSTNSTMFTVIFRKADGEFRKMYCKTGIKRFLSKNPNKKKYKQSKNITVYDCEKKQYRSFNPESVIEFRCKNLILK